MQESSFLDCNHIDDDNNDMIIVDRYIHKDLHMLAHKIEIVRNFMAKRFEGWIGILRTHGRYVPMCENNE